jgi:DNA repair ATPase RecN
MINKKLLIILLSIIILFVSLNQVNSININENYYYNKIENIIKKLNEIYYKGIKDKRLNNVTNLINEALVNIEKGKKLKEEGKLEEAQDYFENAEKLLNEAEKMANKLLEEANIKDQNFKIIAYSIAVISSIITYFSSILMFKFYNYWRFRKLKNCIILRREENE